VEGIAAVLPIVYKLCAGLLILIGLDLKISAMRWRQGSCDLNPLLQYCVKNFGILGGQAALLVSNLLILSLFINVPTILATILGAKIALASIQLRSLLNEHRNSL
jgi:hypothetical protein